MYLLLGTQGCHLCDEAQAIVSHVQKKFPVIIVATDIAEHDEWQPEFALRIPVVYHKSTSQALGWPFTAQDLQSFILETN